ncbi:MAG: translation elongation factor 4, partial [Chloroflexota bacterium]|nr:translation elongation factor 4 [Chloroflexota bacterium]
YEVSRALDACEGALLIVDAAQGIEAQTLANLYLALEANLTIIPVINKIDLPSAQTEDVLEDIHNLLGTPKEQILQISAKQGTNVWQVLQAIVDFIPPPKGDDQAALEALIFDSHYDSYKGVVAYVRVFNGSIKHDDQLLMMSTKTKTSPVEIGIFTPMMTPINELRSGDVGYIATGLKTVSECRVGDTITYAQGGVEKPLPGYKQAKPMVFAGVYPTEGEDYTDLRDALEKLQLNDASLEYQPETSEALNFGFRVGFLGLFHMDIIQERLEREYDMDVVFTAPSVEYQVKLNNGKMITISSPSQLPDENEIDQILEPWMDLTIFTPTDYYGVVMELVTKKRGIFISQEYPSPNRVQIEFEIPLSELIIDFFDQLKSGTRGYASMDYQFNDYRPEKLVKLEILVNGESVDALTAIVHKDDAYHKGQALVSRLKELIPRQMFTIPIQAYAQGRVISRANVKAMRKDVLSKCYGGDITRKKKLLEKQKKGKRRMKMVGNVEIPQEAFMAILRLDQTK